MRVLLAQNAVYYPAHGGANRFNRAVLEGLAARGHTCRAVTPGAGHVGLLPSGTLTHGLERQGVSLVRRPDSAIEYTWHGVQVVATATAATLVDTFRQEIERFQPDRVVVTSEDLLCQLLRRAVVCGGERVIYLANTTTTLPVGPDSFMRGAAADAAPLSRVGRAIASSTYIARYLETWAGCRAATVVRPRVFGDGSIPRYGRPGESGGSLLMINPCAYKGIDIFLGLATRLADMKFVAVRSWGTTSSDLRQLAALPNVTVLDPRDDLEEVYRDTSVLLAPSLWAEGFGLVVIEAMARGIPVLASNVGGLSEAKCGVDYLLPVERITSYRSEFDSNWLPRAEVPGQDLSPWLDAIRQLADPAHYARLSEDSREAAGAFIARCDGRDLEEILDISRADSV